MNKTITVNVIHLLELGARCYVFLMINVYAWGKLMGGQFYRKGKLPAEVATQTLGEVNSFDLAWTFMGHSYFYILFIGIAQLTGSWMLLWHRTKLIGAFILLPILINIVVFDVIFLDRLGALASAGLYLVLTLTILLINYKQVYSAVYQLIGPKPEHDKTLFNKWIQIILVFVLVLILFGVDQFLVNLFGH